MMRYWPDTSINEDMINLVISIISYSHLMQFFFAESDTEKSLDGKIASALINPGSFHLWALILLTDCSLCFRFSISLALFQDVSKKHSWTPRLKLAIELNSTDFVLEEILADSQWTVRSFMK